MQLKRQIFTLAACVLAFVLTNLHVTNIKRKRVESEMQVSLPAPVQLLVAGGDRYLAANISTFRAMTVGVLQLKPETYHVLAMVQRAAAQLNPRHEDNYYTASAVLTWNNETDIAQEILAAATDARTTDSLPPFFHGFDRFYFYHDPVGGAQDLQIAAARAVGTNRAFFTSVAARWYERSQDPILAVTMISKMAEQTRNPGLKRLLLARVTRMEGLIALRDAAKHFQGEKGHPPTSLRDLVGEGLLASLPVDPFGAGYTLDNSGQPMVIRQPDPKPKLETQ